MSSDIKQELGFVYIDDKGNKFLNESDIKQDRIIGFTCSCFDLLHAGHILMLKDAKKQCDYLIVGLQTDPTIDRPKIKNKPIQSLDERKLQIEAVKYVDKVIIYETEKDLYNLIYNIKPDVRIIGSDYKGKYFTGYELCPNIYYHNRNHNFSTSNLRNLIKMEG